MKKTWFEIKALESGEAEISIFDEIGGWGISVTEFKNALDLIKGASAIRLLLNTPGGSVFDGMAMYSLLATVREKLTVEIIGLAASMGTVVALAGKELVMGEGTYFMIHNPWTVAAGDSEELQKVADVLDTMKGEIIKIYASHSNLTADDLAKMMSEETWLTADQAKEMGFASSVKKTADLAACAQFSAKFRAMPAALAQPKPAPLSQEQPAGSASDEKKKEGQKMDPEDEDKNDDPKGVDAAKIIEGVLAKVMPMISQGRKVGDPVDSRVMSEDFKSYLLSQGKLAPKGATIKTTDGFGVPTFLETEIFKRRDLGSYFRRTDLGYTPASVRTYAGDTKVTTKLSYTEAQIVAEGDDYTDQSSVGVPVTLGSMKVGEIYSATEELVEDTVFDVLGEFQDDAVRKLTKFENAKFLKGTGVGQPQGILVGGTKAVTAASFAAVTYAELLALDESLSEEYQDGAVYFASPAFMAAVRGLKDSQNRPILVDAFGGRGSLLFGRPVVRLSAMDGFGVDKKPVVLANLSAYRIGERKIGGTKLKVRVSENTKNGNTEFRWATRLDAKVLDPAAFQYLQMAGA